MEAQGAGQVEVAMGGGSSEIVKRRERKKGGSGGLVMGIAAVVVVGVAGKLLQRFNSRSESSPYTIAAAKEALEKIVAGEGHSDDVLEKVVSPVAESEPHGRGSPPPIETSSSVDSEEKCMGCETPILVEERGRSFDADGGISDQDSSSEDSGSSAVIQVKLPLDKFVAADEAQGTSPTCRNQKIEPAATDLAAQTALPELVHQSMKYDVPSDGNILSKTKNLQDDIAEVISRAFEDFGCGELASQELAPTKLTVQVVWEDKPDPEESDVADTADSNSEPGSESPAQCDAEDISEGFTSQSESGSEAGNVVSDFMDASDTDRAPAGDEVEMEFVNREAQMEDTRINPRVSEPESSVNSPQATTSSELIISSVPAYPSAEIKDQVPEDLPVSAVSEALCSFSEPPHREEDFEQADREYFFVREDSSTILDEAQDDATDSVGECEAFYEETREEAESIVRECEASSSESQEEAEAKHIARENLIVEFTAERQQDETKRESTEVLKEMEPAVVEKFEEDLPSSNADTTTTPTRVDANDAESETDRESVGSEEEEDNATSISEGKLVLKVTTQIIPPQEDGSCEITPAKEVGAGDGEVTHHSAEVNLGTEEEETTEKVKSLVALPSSPCKPNNATRSIRHDETADNSRGNLKKKSAKMTTVEFSRPSLATSKGGSKFKQQESSRGGPELLRMAILVALIAAIVLMLREHIKPLKHAS